MAGLAVIAVVLVFIARSFGGDAAEEGAVDLRAQAAAEQRIKPFGSATVGEAGAVAAAAGGSADAAAGGGLSKGEQVYQQTCFACHGAGVAGAPKTGDAGAWKDRLAQGEDTLYEHAIGGFQGSTGFMPAKGGNPALSDADVKAAVDFMVAELE